MPRPAVLHRRPLLVLATLLITLPLQAEPMPEQSAADETGNPLPTYQISPIGWIRKHDGRTVIEVLPRYREALLGVEQLDAIWVIWWFDRNDDPRQRAILQVHPRGNPANPLRGVFATRAPVRPNLIALTRVNVLGIEDTVIEIDSIDAFADTPVLDLKP
jgi:tRNA-Thr(GGU) m(6)t(6)A37 methyltransferase TsaA